jgi:hypothetical protein
MEASEQDWRDAHAQAIVVYKGSGPLVGFARTGDGHWYEARLPLSGGQPSQPLEREPKHLTAEQAGRSN